MFRPIFARSVDEVDWNILCKNPSAMGILEEYPDQINYDALAENPSAVDFFESRHNYVKWQEMKNPGFVDENFSGIPLGYNLVENMNAIHHIKKFVEKELQSKYRNEWFWTYLSSNPNAIEILERFPEHIDWKKLSGNPSAIELLEKNKDKIVWKKILKNTNASYALLREAITKLGMTTEPQNQKIFEPQVKEYWIKLSLNPNINAVRILISLHSFISQYMDFWSCFACNENPAAVKMIEDKLVRKELESSPTVELLKFVSRYPKAVYVFAENNMGTLLRMHDELVRKALERSHTVEILKILASNPSAIYLFTRENLQKCYIDFDYFTSGLCLNPKAIHILEQYIISLDYKALSENPNAIHLLFPLDTLRMKIKIASFKKELTAYVECPERKSRIFSTYSTPSATQLATSTTTKKRKISSSE